MTRAHCKYHNLSCSQSFLLNEIKDFLTFGNKPLLPTAFYESILRIDLQGKLSTQSPTNETG